MTTAGRGATKWLWSGREPYPPFRLLPFGPPYRIQSNFDFSAQLSHPSVLDAYGVDDEHTAEANEHHELGFTSGQRQHFAASLGY